MSNRELGPIAKELIAAKKRIENPENWCRLHYFKGKQFCARGAIIASDHSWDVTTVKSKLNFLDESAYSLFGTWSMGVNDLPEFGHAAVMQMYDHAIGRAVKEGK